VRLPSNIWRALQYDPARLLAGSACASERPEVSDRRSVVRIRHRQHDWSDVVDPEVVAVLLANPGASNFPIHQFEREFVPLLIK
jgi:hypothetical protein